MHTWIYKSDKKSGAYLYLTRQDDFSAVPDALMRLLGPMKLVMELELQPDRRLARVSVADVLHQLTAQQYFLQLPPAESRPQSDAE